MGADDEGILNEWTLSSSPDQQEMMSFWDETTNTSLEEEIWDEAWDETGDKTPTASPPPASKSRILEALEIYPISSGITTLLERRDINALALSCWSTFHDPSIEDPFSQCSMISQSIRKGHGQYVWGLPEYLSAPCSREHYGMEQEGKDTGIRACGREGCLNNFCNVSVTFLSSSLMGSLNRIFSSSIAGNPHR